MTGSLIVFKHVKGKCKRKRRICALESINMLKSQPRGHKSDIRKNFLLIKAVKHQARAMEVFKMGVNRPLSGTFYVWSKLLSFSKRYQKAVLSVSQQNPRKE